MGAVVQSHLNGLKWRRKLLTDGQMDEYADRKKPDASIAPC